MFLESSYLQESMSSLGTIGSPSLGKNTHSLSPLQLQTVLTFSATTTELSHQELSVNWASKLFSVSKFCLPTLNWYRAQGPKYRVLELFIIKFKPMNLAHYLSQSGALGASFCHSRYSLFLPDSCHLDQEPSFGGPRIAEYILLLFSAMTIAWPHRKV